MGNTVHLGQGRTSTVTHIDTAYGEVATASVGDSIVVCLADDIDLSRGDLVAGSDRPEGSRELTATLQLAEDLPVEPYTGRGLVGSLLLINQADGNSLAAGLVR